MVETNGENEPSPKRQKSTRRAAMAASWGFKRIFDEEIKNKKRTKMQNSVIRRMKSTHEKYQKQVDVLYSKYTELMKYKPRMMSYEDFIKNPPHRFRKVITLMSKISGTSNTNVEKIANQKSVERKTSNKNSQSKSFVSWMLFDRSTNRIAEIDETPVHRGINFLSKYLPIRWGIPGVGIKTSVNNGLVRGVVGPVKDVYAKNNRNIVSGGVSYHNKPISVLNNYLNFKRGENRQRLIVNKFVGPSVDNLSIFVFNETLSTEIRRDALNYKIMGDRFTATTAGMISKNNNILAIKPYDIDISQNIAAYKWLTNINSKENIARKIATKIQTDDNMVFTHACVTTNDRPLALYCMLTGVDVFVDNNAFVNSYAYIKSSNSIDYSRIITKDSILDIILQNKTDLNYHAIFDAFHDFGKADRLHKNIESQLMSEVANRLGTNTITKPDLIIYKLGKLLKNIYEEKYYSFIDKFTSKNVIERVEKSVISLINQLPSDVVGYLTEPPENVCIVDDNFPQNKSRPWRKRIISHAQRLQDGWSGVRLSMKKIKEEYSI